MLVMDSEVSCVNVVLKKRDVLQPETTAESSPVES
jgi:hypothetical protein